MPLACSRFAGDREKGAATVTWRRSWGVTRWDWVLATCQHSLAAGSWAEDLAAGVELAVLWPSNPEVS